MDIEKGLITELTSIDGLMNKVSPVISAQNIATPYLVYTLNNVERENSLNGITGLCGATYQLDIFHSNYSDLKDLSKLVLDKITSLNNRNIGNTNTYIQQIDIENELNFYETEVNLYRQTIEFLIYYKE